MLLIDFSGIAIAPVAMKLVKADDVGSLRHRILDSIRFYRTKFKKYGEPIIVADGGGNWRKEKFPQYKGKRNSDRDKSDIDWQVAFQSITTVLNEIKESFPYKVIHQWGCEADDSIATLVHYTQEFGNWDDVMIVSGDHDFIQLQTLGNVSQFSPIKKAFVKEKDPNLFRKEHLLTGCKGDGVPNVLSEDDSIVSEDKRQNTLTAKKKMQLLEDPKSLGDEVYRNYQRNKLMIDLVEMGCPIETQNQIIESYNTQDKSSNRNKVFPYLVAKNCRQLLENAQEFIN